LDDFGREAVAAIADLGHHRWLRLKVTDGKPNGDVTMPLQDLPEPLELRGLRGLRARLHRRGQLGPRALPVAGHLYHSSLGSVSSYNDLQTSRDGIIIGGACAN